MRLVFEFQSTGDSGMRASRPPILTVVNATSAGGMPAFQYYFEQTSIVIFFDQTIHAINRFLFYLRNGYKHL
jgi:hypothetical protein